MKSGFNILESNSDFDEQQIDFLRKTVAIMKILTKEAIKTAETFVKACGRNQISGNDIYYALMYEAHESFAKDFDTEFFTELENEREHTYYTSDESDDEEDELQYEDEKESYSVDLKNEEHKEFHSKVLKYANEWRNWFPEDPVQMMIKNSIDKTQKSLT